jgi:hypothetical protein
MLFTRPVMNSGTSRIDAYSRARKTPQLSLQRYVGEMNETHRIIYATTLSPLGHCRHGTRRRHSSDYLQYYRSRPGVICRRRIGWNFRCKNPRVYCSVGRGRQSDSASDWVEVSLHLEHEGAKGRAEVMTRASFILRAS